jgi:Zn-dependent protease
MMGIANSGLRFSLCYIPRMPQGSFRLFRVAGIDLFLHWSWFLVAAYEINSRRSDYSSIVWVVAEYLSIFLIVTLHEFGHAFACRQVGGRADRIVLWPLGGVAYVDPPPRPGATLWSIAAGPLVNVALLVIMTLGVIANRSVGSPVSAMPDLRAYLNAIVYINVGLLIFNLLPIYPLDGGQILRSLLWYLVGRARSLMATVVIGFIGVAGLFALAFWMRDLWFGVISVFILMNCWSGLRQAQALAKLAKLPRRDGYACPRCKTAPPVGAYWVCGKCRTPFDTFQTEAVCPTCSTRYSVTKCLDCGGLSPMSEWMAASYAAPKM